jgi:nucleotide-binding universal stress UspA family protein
MEEIKKILIAVDLSKNSLRAVTYVGEMMSCHPSVQVTLLHIVREPSRDIESSSEVRRTHVERQKAEALQLMEEAGQLLIAAGIPEKRICVQIRVCSGPMRVTDIILAEQKGGGYQTVVVGRRGLSRKEEFLFGSVSSRVVQDARECTVWVVE